MTRRHARECAVHMVFAAGFGTAFDSDAFLTEDNFSNLRDESEVYAEPPDAEDAAYIRRVVSGVTAHMPELDSYIENHLTNWRFGRLPRVAVAIMRVCVFETLYMRGEVPPRAAINEAVEISKNYEPPEMVSFINGVLGSYSRKELEEVGKI